MALKTMKDMVGQRALGCVSGERLLLLAVVGRKQMRAQIDAELQRRAVGGRAVRSPPREKCPPALRHVA